MARQLPEDIDTFFLVAVILVFLMINYNLALANIYVAMVIIGSLMYLVPIQFNLFRWIPLVNSKGSLLMKVLIGAGFGFGFIQVYQYFTTTPMAAVFATTIFGESEILTKLVYSGLIPPVETVFFFVTILTWWAWKIGINVNSIQPFSTEGIKLMVLFGAVFVVFHATAKGVENNVDLILTLAFGILSIWMILYFKEAIEAIVMHIIVNAYGMNVFAALGSFAAAGSSLPIFAGIAVIAYLITTKKIKVLS